MSLDAGTQKLIQMCHELVQELEESPSNENPLYLAKLRDLLSITIESINTCLDESQAAEILAYGCTLAHRQVLLSRKEST